MSTDKKQKALETAATASKAKSVVIGKPTTSSTAKHVSNANDDFPLGVIWEVPHGGQLVRFAVTEFNGRRYADLRHYYFAGEEWRPGRGGTMPLWGLSELHSALGRYLTGEVPSEPAEAA